MIPLSLPASIEADAPFVTRLRLARRDASDSGDSVLVEEGESGLTFAGPHGLLAIDGLAAGDLDGDVVLAQGARVERLIRAQSPHNTLLVTERCDQLCVMCSQPPKKTHVDRFDLLAQACVLAPKDMLIGITGGEPTLFKEALFEMIERVLTARPDLRFHVLTNGQHFELSDVDRLARPLFRRVSWGVPLYAADAALHDAIVGKAGAFVRLRESFAVLIRAGARVELRTVVLKSNVGKLADLAAHIRAQLRFIEAWSIMQLEHIGFAKGRWGSLYYDHGSDFAPIAEAIDVALLHGIRAQLFNFPRCTVPAPYRALAPASISDWKRKYAPACAECAEKVDCCGFFEWHPDEQMLIAARVH